MLEEGGVCRHGDQRLQLVVEVQHGNRRTGHFHRCGEFADPDVLDRNATGVEQLGNAAEENVEFFKRRAAQTIDQDRDTLDGFTASSDPHAQLFNAGFELRNTFQVSDSLAITPKVGLDYTHVAMSDYSENGGSALNLDVNSDDLDSLQSVVGAKAEWMFTPLIGLDAHGYYRYEFLDTQVRFASEFLGLRDVSFETESPDLNGHSGNIGAAFIFVPAENASVNLGYDLWLADEYVGHQISATMQMEF